MEGGSALNQNKSQYSLFQSKKKKRRRNVRKKTVRSSDSEDGETSLGGGDVVKPKVQKVEGSMAFSTQRAPSAELFTFESSKEVERVTNDATRNLNDGQKGVNYHKDAMSQVKGKSEDGIYKGIAAYKDYRAVFRKEQNVGPKPSTMYGPAKPSTNVRMTVLVDYQPDVCKDYKETGYCGFGDSCKFLHDRGDYKSGWELDRDWEEMQKIKRERERQGWVDASSDDDNDDDLPFACFICREPWDVCQDPVITRCGHYFCEQCALKHNAKSKKCFVCGKPTGGIFNAAQDIMKRERKIVERAST